jgi:hypothetical protein
MRLRHPLRLSWARFASWTRCFLSGYLEQCPPGAAGSLIFFYTWGLLQCLLGLNVEAGYAKRRPWLRSYVERYYSLRLRRLLTGLGEATPEGAGRSVPEIFTNPGAL